MNALELRKKPVVSLSDGEKMGEVDDVLIATNELKMSALQIKGAHGKGVLPLADIRSVGKDAVTTESAQLIQWATGQATDGLRPFSEVSELTVVDSSGTTLGAVHDIEFDSEWRIALLDVRSGGVFGVGAHQTKVDCMAIRKIGPKVITVDTAPAVP